jgi:S-adenosylmethionine:tRNA ribosyltransferase-isomerase
MSSQLSDYDFDLPRELIASRPLAQRDASRMMVIRRESEKIEHRSFRELPQFVRPGDLFVLNDTRVVPARRFSDDGRIEFLFLERLAGQRWRCLVKPGRKMRLGARAVIDGVQGTVVDLSPTGERTIEFQADVDMHRGGSVPIPPYLDRESDDEDLVRYQTVYAQNPGAVAAPTAGLHFTGDILQQLPHAFLTLHVGPGTFQPVQSDNIEEHRMHGERFEISEETANRINSAERVVAVGTTCVRVLESIVRDDRTVLSQEGITDIFIRPPFTFRRVEGMLTNFHLPRSTLLMLVSAFAGRELILRASDEAVREKYRFFSYGDCMLIL